MQYVEPIKDNEVICDFEDLMRKRGDREHIIFLLGVYTGLRISDLLKLKVKDVKGKTHLNLIEQKTGKEKRVFINPNLKRELKDYIQDKDINSYLILSRKGANKPLTRQRVWGILTDVANELGLDNIGCHTLRKTFGYHHYTKTGDIAFLQELYNHRSPTTTLRYLGLTQEVKDKAIKSMDFRRRR